MVYVGDYIGQR